MNQITKTNPQAQTEQREMPKSVTALAAMAGRLQLSQARLQDTLAKTAFKACETPEEFTAALVVANEYGLNPLTKEIYAFKVKGGGVSPIVSVDGWISIMNQHPAFDGIEFEDIVDDGEIVAIEAIIHRKDRSKPIRVTEYMVECRGSTDPWKKTPNRMLRHRALMQCARIAFGFSGIAMAGDEEIGYDQSAESVAVIPSDDQLRDEHQAEILDGEITEDDERIARELDAAQGDGPATGGAVDMLDQLKRELDGCATAAEITEAETRWDPLLAEWDAEANHNADSLFAAARDSINKTKSSGRQK